ncbi:MAG: Tad domain-containing protein, partial [Methylobacteriaceae bacterium]|nr:Tad domain-containing protein [Methylobacteriaceae bacterium]
MGIIFGLMVAPMAFLVGAAVDYSGAVELRTRLQRATDATALQLCKMAATTTDTQLRTQAQTSLTSQLGTQTYSIEQVSGSTNPRQVTLATAASFSTAFLRGFGSSYEAVPIRVVATCQTPQD